MSTCRKPRPIMRDIVFTFLLSYMRQHGRAPTANEIGNNLWLSRSAVYRNLRQLENEGRIARRAGQPRSIQVLQ